MFLFTKNILGNTFSTSISNLKAANSYGAKNTSAKVISSPTQYFPAFSSKSASIAVKPFIIAG